jgi:5-methylcytosine-specific restriction endonuclease McrA
LKKHTKVYLQYFGYGPEEFMPCEICGARMVDIHHIEARGMGGSGEKDNIENLMGLCRSCHVEFGDKKHHIEYLKSIHERQINSRKD